MDYLVLAAEKSNRKGAVQTTREFAERALSFVETSGLQLDPTVQAKLYDQRARACRHMGDLDSAIESFRAVVDMSRRHGIPKEERKALRGLVGLLVWYLTRMKRGEVVRKFAPGHETTTTRPFRAYCLRKWAFGMVAYGDPGRGCQLTIEAEQLAITTGEPLPIFSARLIRAVMERWLGHPDKTIELTEGVVELLHMRFGLSALPAAIIIRGIALAELGRIEEAMATIKKGIEVCEKYGAFQPVRQRSTIASATAMANFTCTNVPGIIMSAGRKLRGGFSGNR